MSGHRAIAVRSETALSSIAGLLGVSSNELRTTAERAEFLAPLEERMFAFGKVGQWMVAWDAISSADTSSDSQR